MIEYFKDEADIDAFKCHIISPDSDAVTEIEESDLDDFVVCVDDKDDEFTKTIFDRYAVTKSPAKCMSILV